MVGSGIERVEVATATAAERNALVGVLARAFLDNPMNVMIHGPSRRRRLRANRAGLRALFLDPGRKTEPRVVRKLGAVVGGYVAVAPGLYPLAPPGIRRQIGCFIHQGAGAMEQWGNLDAVLSLLHPKSPHWYIAVLGVEPLLWEHGLGGRLLDDLIERAAAQPAPIYLETDRPENLGFYGARGFEVLSAERPLGVPVWRMALGLTDG